MIITGMAHFESVCKKKLVDWYHKNKPGVEIDLSNVFVVWACKTLQNYTYIEMVSFKPFKIFSFALSIMALSKESK